MGPQPAGGGAESVPGARAMPATRASCVAAAVASAPSQPGAPRPGRTGRRRARPAGPRHRRRRARGRRPRPAPRAACPAVTGSGISTLIRRLSGRARRAGRGRGPATSRRRRRPSHRASRAPPPAPGRPPGGRPGTPPPPAAARRPRPPRRRAAARSPRRPGGRAQRAGEGVHLGGGHLDGHGRSLTVAAAPAGSSSTGPAAGQAATRSGVHSVHRSCPQAVDNLSRTYAAPVRQRPRRAASGARPCPSCWCAGRSRR